MSRRSVLHARAPAGTKIVGRITPPAIGVTMRGLMSTRAPLRNPTCAASVQHAPRQDSSSISTETCDTRDSRRSDSASAAAAPAAPINQTASNSAAASTLRTSGTGCRFEAESGGVACPARAFVSIAV
jgi:hypothetical protein